MDNNSSDQAAITPDTFEMPTIEGEPIANTETKAVELASQDDKELAALNTSRGWQRIAERMRTDIDALRNMTRADLEGLTREEVGDKFLISSAVADRLQNYLDQVEHATKAVMENDRQGK